MINSRSSGDSLLLLAKMLSRLTVEVVTGGADSGTDGTAEGGAGMADDWVV